MTPLNIHMHCYRSICLQLRSCIQVCNCSAQQVSSVCAKLNLCFLASCDNYEQFLKDIVKYRWHIEDKKHKLLQDESSTFGSLSLKDRVDVLLAICHYRLTAIDVEVILQVWNWTQTRCHLFLIVVQSPLHQCMLSSPSWVTLILCYCLAELQRGWSTTATTWTRCIWCYLLVLLWN